MEGDAAAAILQVLIQNLIDASKKEISLIRGLDKDAEKLTATLHIIQKFLNDAEMRTVPQHEDAFNNWLKKLDDAAFDADHVLDELNYHLLSKNIKKTIKPTKQKVLSCLLFSTTHISRPRKIALKIKEINENLDSINKEATELGLIERLANVPALPDVGSTETDSYTLDPIFVGRDGVLSELVEEIITAADDDKSTDISILSIVGMGGLGKTTLTRKVFNHGKIETRFGSRIWVHVSQIFDPIVLLKKILKELKSSAQAESRQEIVKMLAEVLKDKVYFLVLDDVWNEDAPKWGDFINSLKGVTSTTGNAIVVTTRKANVALIVNPLCKHELEGLSEEYCWSIIKEKTFGKGVDAPSEIESIGRNIARRCHGLPLAANVVGGVLQRDRSKENWVSIEQKWLSSDDGENIKRILRLSFNSLSSPSLKKCFAYCSMFPKGTQIEKQELIEQWMAEGFLQPDDGSNDDMECVGEKFINILLHSSLLQVQWRDDGGNVAGCSMHDHVHDLACSVLGSSGIRYRVLDGESVYIDRREMEYCRTLVINNWISGIDFSHFECLHVLTLDNYGVFVEELPSSIKKLIHLRKLKISGMRIKSLPDWIGELHYLQTLRAMTYYLEKLPSTIKYLTNMRHLYLDKKIVLPAGIGGLTCLQTLKYFGVGDESGCKIEELGCLKDLKGKLEIYNLERVLTKQEAAKANLFSKSKILELCLEWDESREGEIENDEHVLEGLQPHADLNELSIRGFKGKRFPTWTMKMAVQNVAAGGSWIALNKLIKISLLDCSECEEIPMLGHLPNLKSLRLLQLSNVKHINSSGCRDTRIVFPALETLQLYGMPKLVQVEFDGGSDVQVFPRLRSLEIRRCDQLMGIGTHSLPCLKYLQIGSSYNSMHAPYIFQIKYGMLTELELLNLSDLEVLPDWLFNENPNLSKLQIRKCPKLREVAQGLRTLFSSLKELIIEDCPCLEKITDDGKVEQSQSESESVGSSFFIFTSLSIIRIKGCDALLCVPPQLVGASLEQLSLESLSSLKNLPDLIDACIARSSRLKTLIVTGVPKFMASSSGRVEDWGFDSLRKLDIDVNNVEGSMETVDGILQGCRHSLGQLRMTGTDDCDRLPESIQRLTALYELTFENFGMEELPERLGNLSSLYSLYICDCKKLRRLPSMDAMRRLQSLHELDIVGCPELMAQGVADPEWPKVSHLYSVYIDGIPPNAVDSPQKCSSCTPLW